MSIKDRLLMSSPANNLQFQWAQNTAEASDTKVLMIVDQSNGASLIFQMLPRAGGGNTAARGAFNETKAQEIGFVDLLDGVGVFSCGGG